VFCRCFKATETVRTVSEVTGLGQDVQDVHLLFHTAPELSAADVKLENLIYVPCQAIVPCQAVCFKQPDPFSLQNVKRKKSKNETEEPSGTNRARRQLESRRFCAGI